MAAGKYDTWQSSPYPCLAGIVLMDQFSRCVNGSTRSCWPTSSIGLACNQGTVGLIPGPSICLASPANQSKSLLMIYSIARLLQNPLLRGL
jgi:hypothetical protein